jgi:hypothetical protein
MLAVLLNATTCMGLSEHSHCVIILKSIYERVYEGIYDSQNDFCYDRRQDGSYERSYALSLDID